MKAVPTQCNQMPIVFDQYKTFSYITDFTHLFDSLGSPRVILTPLQSMIAFIFDRIFKSYQIGIIGDLHSLYN